MPERLDYLGECNDQKVPLEDFKLAFCDRCLQPECSRSLHGTSKFDQRVSTWVERLVTKVPRMDPADPRIPQIQGKQFKMFTPSLSVGQAPSAWLDPKDVKEPSASSVEEPAPAAEEEQVPPLPPVFVRPPEPALVPEEVPSPPTISPQIAEKSEQTGMPLALMVMNTPTQSGRMLAGSPAQTPPSPPKDPWEAPPTSPKPADGEVVVKKGATVRLGSGSGVE